MSVVRMIKDIERRIRSLERRSSAAVTGPVRLQNVGGESGYHGGFVAGDVQWNTTTGQPTSGTGGLFNEAGFFGVKAGANTFKLDFATGDATFLGTITAGDMSFGVDVSGSNDGLYINATNYWYDTGHFKMANGALSWSGGALTFAGTISGSTVTGGTISGSTVTGGTISGSTVTGGTISGATITGATIQTAASGRRMRFTGSSQTLEWLNGASQEGFITTDASGNMLIDANNLITLQATGSGDSVFIDAGENVFLSAKNFIGTFTGNFQTNETDSFILNYNSDNNNSQCYWNSDGNLRMRLDENGEVTADGSFSGGGADFAEMFETIDGETIDVGVSVVLDNGKIKRAKRGDSPIGVISSNPTVVGNVGGCDSNSAWTGKYERDEFGSVIYEDAEWWTVTKTKKVVGANGKKKKVSKRHNGWSDKKKPPKGAKSRVVRRRKVSPGWKDTGYVQRKDRKEWCIVGLIGRLPIKRGEVIGKRWIKIRDISKNVAEYLIK